MGKSLSVSPINAGHTNADGDRLTVAVKIPQGRAKVISMLTADHILLTDEDVQALQKQLKQIDKVLTNKLF